MENLHNRLILIIYRLKKEIHGKDVMKDVILQNVVTNALKCKKHIGYKFADFYITIFCAKIVTIYELK